MQIINRNSYTLLIGDNSLELFDFFRSSEIHGLKKADAEAFTDTPESCFIAGMANYHPLDKNLTMLYKPFIFINKRRLNGTYKDVLMLMHEYLHMAKILVGGGITDAQEEGVTTWIEKEINWIIESGTVGIFEQGSTHYV
jgi:hypothetical protein